MNNNSNKCWICGELAESREHAIKETDAKHMFKNEAAEVRAVFFENGKRSAVRPIQGPKSNLLKFKHKICKKCNNETTQPYDLAQIAFVTFVRENTSRLCQSKPVQGNEIFQQCARQKLKDLQLYFVKWAGCMIADEYNGIDLKEMAAALKTRKPLLRLFLQFAFDSEQHHDGTGYMSFLSEDKQTLIFNYFLQEKFVVQIFYDLVKIDRSAQLQTLWHPQTCSGKIVFHNY
jgi:hypothetical protein